MSDTVQDTAADVVAVKGDPGELLECQCGM